MNFNISEALKYSSYVWNCSLFYWLHFHYDVCAWISFCVGMIALISYFWLVESFFSWLVVFLTFWAGCICRGRDLALEHFGTCLKSFVLGEIAFRGRYHRLGRGKWQTWLRALSLVEGSLKARTRGISVPRTTRAMSVGRWAWAGLTSLVRQAGQACMLVLARSPPVAVSPCDHWSSWRGKAPCLWG